MDFNALLVGILESLVAGLPQFTVLGSVIYYGIKQMKTETSKLPFQLNETKNTLNVAFLETKEKLTQTYLQSKEQMETTVKKLGEDIYDNVVDVMSEMRQELASYQSQLKNTANQLNLVVRENKAFMDIIAILLSKDPQKIREGVTTVIASKLNMTKEELEKYPERLVTDLNVLQIALKEAFLTLGKEQFETLLRSVGYGQIDEERNKL